VQGFTEPGGAAAPEALDSDPSSYWASPWPSGTTGRSCSDTPPRMLRLTWPDAVRVRALRVSPGLREGAKARLLHPRPATLLVTWEDPDGKRLCRSLTIPDDPAARELEVDTETPVDTLWLAVGSVHEAQNATLERPVAIRTVRVLSRP
jgi:hypothetical protein